MQLQISRASRVIGLAPFIAALSLAAPLHAATWYVDDTNCPGPGTGSVGDPFCSIQAGIDIAADGDTVLVMPGLYAEIIDLDGKQILLDSQSGPGSTRIVGTGLADSVVTCTNGETASTRIRGFSILGGVGKNIETTPGNFERLGGAMYIIAGCPTVEDCIITQNSAVRGGGIYGEQCDSYIADTEFFGNDAENGDSSFDNRGGGAHFQDSTPVFFQCTFEANTAHFGAGLNLRHSPATVDHTEFRDNVGARGGGLHVQTSDAVIEHCQFIDNLAVGAASVTGLGAGISGEFGADITVNDCLFQNNQADRHGGGVHSIDNAALTFRSCQFIDNSAGIGSGGGILCSGFSNPTVINSAFLGNTAGFRGGGLMTSTNSPGTIVNSTFYNNTAGNDGGGVFFVESTCSLHNSILWSNTPDQVVTIETPTVRYCDVEGGFGGLGNINADPLFVNAPANDIDLQPGSPCIDAANNAAPALTGISQDIDDDPRYADDPVTADTGAGAAPLIDMGVHEFQPLPPLCPGDTNGDQQIDTDDFLAVLGNWGPCPNPCPPTCTGDTNDDCLVNTDDFLAVLGNWGPCIEED